MYNTIDRYVELGRISQEQADAIMEKNAGKLGSLFKRGIVEPIVKKLTKSKVEKAKRAAEELRATKRAEELKRALDEAANQPKSVAESLKKAFSNVKDIFTSKEGLKLIAPDLATFGVAGSIAGAATLKSALEFKKAKEANYRNLIAQNPELKEENQNKIKRLVNELTSMSPMAAANDSALYNYVMDGLGKKLRVTDMAAAPTIRSSRQGFSSRFSGLADPKGYMRAYSHSLMKPISLVDPRIAYIEKNPSEHQKYLFLGGAISSLPMEDRKEVFAELGRGLVSRISKGKAREYVAEAKKRMGGMMDDASLYSYMEKLYGNPEVRRGMNSYSSGTKKQRMEKKGNVSTITKLIEEAVETGVKKALKGGMKGREKQGLLQTLKNTALLSLPFMGVGAGVGTAHAFYAGQASKQTNEKINESLKKVKASHDLRGRGREVEAAFDTLRKYAPSLATQPQTALPFVRSAVLDYADPATGFPMVDASQVKTLVDIQRSHEASEASSPFSSASVRGFGRGFEGALKATRGVKDVATTPLLEG